MNTLTILIILIVLAAVGLIVYRLIAFKKANAKISKKRFERVQQLFDKLENGESITKTEVYDYAKNILTREITFKLLQHSNLSHIFPDEFNTFEKAAESNLVNWLEFPTELDTCPDEIEHVKRVKIGFSGQNNFFHYEVFKFKVHEPHWAAKDGWMLGAVGPYFDDSKPYDRPNCTFSRLNRNSYNTSPDEEAKWIHENILMKR